MRPRRRVTVLIAAAVLLAASLTACSAEFGGVAGVAVDAESGDVVVVAQLCEPTEELGVTLSVSTGDDPGDTKDVWDAEGTANGSRVVVDVAEPPTSWTVDLDEPLPPSDQISLVVLSRPRGADADDIWRRLRDVQFRLPDLPRTDGSSPARLAYEEDQRTVVGSTAEIAAVTKQACDPS